MRPDIRKSLSPFRFTFHQEPIISVFGFSPTTERLAFMPCSCGWRGVTSAGVQDQSFRHVDVGQDRDKRAKAYPASLCFAVLPAQHSTAEVAFASPSGQNITARIYGGLLYVERCAIIVGAVVPLNSQTAHFVVARAQLLFVSR
jgi:hypothetical protein